MKVRDVIMPSTITHEYHYRDIYEHTNKNFKNKYNREDYLKYSSFAQGHDTLFFLDFCNLPKQGFYHAKAYYLQNHRFRDICLEILKISKEYQVQNSKELKLLLYGYMMHHLLDSVAHPFIIYETESLGLHLDVESYFDQYLINLKENNNARKYPVHKIIPKVPAMDVTIEKVLDEAFYNIYQYESFGSEYIRALKQIQVFLYLFRYDPSGIKRIGYKFIDNLNLFASHFSWLSYYNKLEGFSEYLNEEKNIWNNPVDNSIVSNKSFMELYEDSTNDIAKIISDLDEAINDDASICELKEIIPNVSATHGKECDQDLSLIYIKK